MLEEMFTRYLPFPIHVLELMGIIVLLIGAIRAFFLYIKTIFANHSYQIKYQFSESMAMALEFKLAAEILKTVLIRNIQEIALLAAIVLLRILIIFIIYWEIKQDKLDNTHNANTSATKK